MDGRTDSSLSGDYNWGQFGDLLLPPSVDPLCSSLLHSSHPTSSHVSWETAKDGRLTIDGRTKNGCWNARRRRSFHNSRRRKDRRRRSSNVISISAPSSSNCGGQLAEYQKILARLDFCAGRPNWIEHPKLSYFAFGLS